MALAATEKGVTSFSPGRGNVSVARPLRLHVAGEKPGEGNPTDPGQARVQVSTHEEGGGASVGPIRGRPSLHPLKDMTRLDSFLEYGRNAGKAGLIQGGANTLSRFVREFGQLLTPHLI
jgi:hypothetical protein